MDKQVIAVLVFWIVVLTCIYQHYRLKGVVNMLGSVIGLNMVGYIYLNYQKYIKKHL